VGVGGSAHTAHTTPRPHLLHCPSQCCTTASFSDVGSYSDLMSCCTHGGDLFCLHCTHCLHTCFALRACRTAAHACTCAAHRACLLPASTALFCTMISVGTGDLPPAACLRIRTSFCRCSGDRVCRFRSSEHRHLLFSFHYACTPHRTLMVIVLEVMPHCTHHHTCCTLPR